MSISRYWLNTMVMASSQSSLQFKILKLHTFLMRS
uniref:Uncharacterized protein n=1 Tax=Arundo donax TaxID=35708 RepID=A0A0A9AI00_ARUDO